MLGAFSSGNVFKVSFGMDDSSIDGIAFIHISMEEWDLWITRPPRKKDNRNPVLFVTSLTLFFYKSIEKRLFCPLRHEHIRYTSSTCSALEYLRFGGPIIKTSKRQNVKRPKCLPEHTS